MRVWSIFLLALMTTATAGAQGTQPAPPRSAPDFFFGRPGGWLGFRAGWVFARAGSDWYDFVSDQLTIERNDFSAPHVAGDVGVTLSDRVDLVVGVASSSASNVSEYRDFVDNKRLPINQTTTLKTLGLTGSLRFALTERGRAVGRLAWVPSQVTPFVGAGGGALWYHLEQEGDFVDFVDLSVFPAYFDSEGWTPSAHVLGGVDVRVLRRVLVTIDGRYQWAATGLTRTWVDFDPLDLSGFTLTAGLSVVF